MNLPFGMRASTLEERKRFYEGFDLQKATGWIGRKVVYVVIIGRHSGIYPPQFEEDKSVPLVIDNYKTLDDVMKYVMKYLPEGIYYDRNYYHDFSLCHSHDLKDAWDWDNFAGQQLAFDIDSENVTCPEHGTLKERMKRGEGLSFCEKAFEIARKNTSNLFDALTQNYSDLRIVFSGRGFHIHVFDKDTITLTRDERKKIASDYLRFGIDRWVTEGEMRLIRLPYSLNGTSSRIVTPIKKSELGAFNQGDYSAFFSPSL
ncbi:MAG: DNA primase [Candidatus Diapherotrites archaeon]|nr:DNA primase [Candidatus Diapherotrites archaeon]